MKATLNGAHSLDLSQGESLVVRADEGFHRVVFSRRRGAEVLWESDPLALAPEPSREHSSSGVADFLAITWPAGSAVVALGYPAAIVLDADSGRVRATFPLEFTGKESLEQVGLGLSDDGQRLMITSTKRLWVIAPSLEPVLRYEPQFMLAGLPRGGVSEVAVDEYDFDSDREVVTRVIPITGAGR